MKKLFASMLCLTLAFGLTPIELVAGTLDAGQIGGTATVDGRPLQNVTGRLRNIDTGRLVSSTMTNSFGQFNFSNLPAGNFVVEAIGPNGMIVGTSAPVVLTAKTMSAGSVRISTTAAVAAAAGVAAAGRAAQQPAGGAAAGGSFFTSTAGIITLSAIAAASIIGITMAVTGS